MPRPPHPHRQLIRAALLAAVLTVACSRDDGAAQSDTSGVDPTYVPTAVVSRFPRPPVESYRAETVGRASTVTGLVRFAGALPADTVVPPASATCGAGARAGALRVDSGRVANAIVWLTNVRTGEPLPLERRFELTLRDCRVQPRVQAVIAGGTLNVRSQDAVPHRTRFIRTHTAQTLALIRQTDPGSVVPNAEVLERPGLIEVRDDAHPWTRGYLAVFDHPYFAVTGTDGAYAIDGVPPGEWQLAVWHERLGLIARTVIVPPGAQIVDTATYAEPTLPAERPQLPPTIPSPPPIVEPPPG